MIRELDDLVNLSWFYVLPFHLSFFPAQICFSLVSFENANKKNASVKKNTKKLEALEFCIGVGKAECSFSEGELFRGKTKCTLGKCNPMCVQILGIS